MFSTIFVFVPILATATAYAHESNTTAPIVSDIQAKTRPWTDRAPKNDPDDFQFVVVTDRTGGHRPGVFSEGMEKVNLLQPEIVVSVGDLIEGYTEDVDTIQGEWDEFGGFLDTLDMPFFYVPGNHDYSNPVMAEIWQDRFGPSYYSFVYRDVLFLCLNTMEAGNATLGGDQIKWLRKTLTKHRRVRWTVVLMHHPLWAYDDFPEWPKVANALRGRKYTAFAGHWHQYARYVRNDQTHIVLATTGGGSQMRGPLYGEFDHVIWATMTDDGPILANLMLDGIRDEHIRSENIADLVDSFERRGALRFDPIYVTTPETIGDLRTRLHVRNDGDTPLSLAAQLTSTNGDILEGVESINVTVESNSTENVDVALSLTQPYPLGEPLPIHLDWSVTLPSGPEIEAPLMGSLVLGADRKWPAARVAQTPGVDGDLSEWQDLDHESRFEFIDNKSTGENWRGPEDSSFKFELAHDDAFVYLAIEVTDDDVLTEPLDAPLAPDGVIVFFDARPDPERSNGRGEDSGYETLLLGSSPVPAGYPQRPRYRPELLPEGLQIANALTRSGFNVEMSIPVAYLEQKQGAPWQAFRLHIQMFDADTMGVGNKQSAIAWRPYWGGPGNIPGSGTFVRQ